MANTNVASFSSRLLSSALLALLILTVFLALSCSANLTKQQRLAKLPFWKQSEKGEDYIYVYGSAAKLNQRMSSKAAEADAYAELGKVLEERLGSLACQYWQEAGLDDDGLRARLDGVVKKVVSYHLTGSYNDQMETRLVGKKAKQRFESYVRLAVPKEGLYKTMFLLISEDDILLRKLVDSASFRTMAPGQQIDNTKETSEEN